MDQFILSDIVLWTILACTVSAALLWDGIMIYLKGFEGAQPWTFSRRFLHWCRTYPLLTFLIGLPMGHLLIPDYENAFGVRVGLWCGLGLVGLWDAIMWYRNGWSIGKNYMASYRVYSWCRTYPFPAFLFGMLFGYLVIPQHPNQDFQ